MAITGHTCTTAGRHLGFWDANPATLVPLSPEDSAPLYVEMMGGQGKIMARSQELYDKGEYRLAMEILNKLVYAEPKNQSAKDLLADTFEQLGYQYESPSNRTTRGCRRRWAATLRRLSAMEWTTAGEGPRFGMLVHHTDAERELAYDREGHIGVLQSGLDEGPKRGWTIVKMKDDWKQVFPE